MIAQHKQRFHLFVFFILQYKYPFLAVLDRTLHIIFRNIFEAGVPYIFCFVCEN